MERFFSALLSYLLIAPAALLCYAPMKGQLRYGRKKLLLIGTGILAASVLLCILTEHRLFTSSNLMPIPLCVILFIIY